MMPSIEACEAGRTTPALQMGDARYDGSYYRNLARKALRKRYEKDSDPEPRHGRKLKWKKAFRWDPGLSVNCADCLPEPACSIVLDEHAEKHAYVLEISIAELSELTGVTTVAVYKPNGNNVCHFELLPLDEDIEDLMKAFERVFDVKGKSDPSWPDVRVPRSDEDMRAAGKMKAQFERAFRVAYQRASPA